MKSIARFFRGRRRLDPGSEDQRVGDAARDRRDWAAAQAAYKRYLALNPQAWPIWVQRGHALKESDDLPAAERCYRQAADLQPMEAETFLHLGDVLRRLNRHGDAIVCIRRAAALGDRRAFIDLTNMGVTAQSDEPIGELPPWITVENAARLLVDAQAMRDKHRWRESQTLYLSYLRHRPTSEQAKRELTFVREAASRDGDVIDGDS